MVVTDGGSLTASTLIISKQGDSSNTENSEFYGLGLNAAVLVQKESEATIKDTTIKTNASGANAVFATRENAIINVSNKLPQLEIHHVVQMRLMVEQSTLIK